jgi:acyl-CoA synthetase (AMP-forming)/AMP-acid ligase II
VVIGTPSDGAWVKVCEPEGMTLLPSGTPKERHQAGPQLISEYLGGQAKDELYVDEKGVRWFKTCD